jgi:NifU-like protein involved in Fe-S cluster formation
MDEAVVRYYRGLLKTGFDYAGTLENPTIFLDAVGENLTICDHVGQDSLELYVSVEKGTVKEIKYLCTCDPATNVAVEIMCALIKGKTIAQVEMITPESFLQVLGNQSEDLIKKAEGLLELLRRGIVRYLTKAS